LQKSIDYYNQAIKLDPNYAPAYAHMAQAYSFLAFFGALSPSEGWGKAKEAASLAVQKDDRLPEGHGALALAKLHYDWILREQNRNSSARWSSTPATPMSAMNMRTTSWPWPACRIGGREQARRGTRPRRRRIDFMPVLAQLRGRDYDEAVRLAAKFLKSQPDDPGSGPFSDGRMSKSGCRIRPSRNSRGRSSRQRRPFFVAALGHAMLSLATGAKRRRFCRPSRIVPRSLMSHRLTSR